MSERSLLRLNIAGVVTAIVGFTVGSLKGPMGAGGLHSTVGAIVGLIGAVSAVSALVAGWHRRRGRRIAAAP